MNQFINALNAKRRNIAAVVLMTTSSLNSFGQTLGGLQTATTAADDIRTGLYGLAGAIAGIYILWLGLMAKTEKKSWSDFGWGVVHVSLVGAAVALATWAWSLFA